MGSSDQITVHIKRDQQLSTKESSDPRLIFQLFDMLARYHHFQICYIVIGLRNAKLTSSTVRAAPRLRTLVSEHLSESSHPY
jgi:hypothetical protein